MTYSSFLLVVLGASAVDGMETGIETVVGELFSTLRRLWCRQNSCQVGCTLLILRFSKI